MLGSRVRAPEGVPKKTFQNFLRSLRFLFFSIHRLPIDHVKECMILRGSISLLVKFDFQILFSIPRCTTVRESLRFRLPLFADTVADPPFPNCGRQARTTAVLPDCHGRNVVSIALSGSTSFVIRPNRDRSHRHMEF